MRSIVVLIASSTIALVAACGGEGEGEVCPQTTPRDGTACTRPGAFCWYTQEVAGELIDTCVEGCFAASRCGYATQCGGGDTPTFQHWDRPECVGPDASTDGS